MTETVAQAIETNEDLHEKIDSLELSMLNSPEHLIDLPLVHKFTPGMYIREIFNPAGVLITTKVHKIEHPFILLRGRISLWIPENGGRVEHLTAPYIGITRAGTRRVIFAHEDSVFITFHANPDNGQDLDLIESRIIEQRLLPGSDLSANKVYKQLLSNKEPNHFLDNRM